VNAEQGFPQLRQVVLDCTDARRLAEFYRRLLGLRYRPGDEPPPAGEPDPRGRDWLVLADTGGRDRLAFQQVAALPEATWPEGPVPQQLHLDLTVPTAADLDVQHRRALGLGCTTAPTTRRSRCGSTPTRRGIRSASSSPARPAADPRRRTPYPGRVPTTSL
jgi:catechol 2,3-dioxygenase-like lactoylglutathione lyase family enzyme